MSVLSKNSNAKMILTVKYSINSATHIDHYYCGSVNLWRDAFTPVQQEALLGMETGESRVVIENELACYDSSKVFRIGRNQWQPERVSGAASEYQPRVGRWYPQGFVTGVGMIFKETLAPMLISAIEGDEIVIDCNHPLAGRSADASVKLEELSLKNTERGGRCADWLEDAIADGPGIQIIRAGVDPDYEEENAFLRADETVDTTFYSISRMVNHIDKQARKHLLNSTTAMVDPGMKVLDLMSSMESHLPKGLNVTGLGMNDDEMRGNPALSEYVLHDLNSNPKVPFADETFDFVCCHLSIEYLLNPAQVMAELARVLRPEGKILISFSNRWFPQKVVRIWQMLHEFERMRYVMAKMINHFKGFTTTSFRNWPRPEDDPHYFEIGSSDPLYIVKAGKR